MIEEHQYCAEDKKISLRKCGRGAEQPLYAARPTPWGSRAFLVWTLESSFSPEQRSKWGRWTGRGRWKVFGNAVLSICWYAERGRRQPRRGQEGPQDSKTDPHILKLYSESDAILVFLNILIRWTSATLALWLIISPVVGINGGDRNKQSNNQVATCVKHSQVP